MSASPQGHGVDAATASVHNNHTGPDTIVSTAVEPLVTEAETLVDVSSGNQPGAGAEAPQNMQFIEETGRWTYMDSEGVSFEYDENMKAWFPMFNENLMQAQQSAYGETIPDSMESVLAENNKRQKRKKNEIDYTGSSGTYDNPKKQRGGPHKERKPKPNTSVFVSGLPLDATLEEMMEVFKKGGVFMEDENEQPRIKLYSDKEGRPNGEGLVSYLRPESVALSIDLLDDTEFRPGVEKCKIRVQQAQFKEKERPAQPSVVTDERKKKVQKKFQKLEKKLDWYEDDDRLSKAEKWNKVCILKRMFTLAELEADPSLLLDLKEDIREECEKVGEVTNVIIYDRNPDGVVAVRFKEKESTPLCVQLMNGRYFAGQRVQAEVYDGHTKYEGAQRSKEELEEEEKQRLERYAKWLETQEEEERKKKEAEQPGSQTEAGSVGVASSDGSGSAGGDDGETTIRVAADAPTP
ncbi:hypothetical protein BGW38_003361 [Lunasporangiospora selenospora]|uniref:RRM domain-containing protein n=1 Tax=Lunasporangiospora selenospora TaxID=979761 RepID=A0A9P6KHX1_9FUNG|nr:hypothetical protein BGW38_003361 [Lunasporangiospora selenospora]